MKNFKQLTIVIILLATIIFSCKKVSEISENNNAKNLGLINTSEKITTLSNFSKLIGVSSLNRTSIKENLVSYKLEANQVRINNTLINLNDANYIYSIDNDYINIKMNSGNKNVTLILNNNDKSIFYKEKNILLEANQKYNNISESDNADISIAMAILIELTNKKNNQI